MQTRQQTRQWPKMVDRWKDDGVGEIKVKPEVLPKESVKKDTKK